MYKLNASSLTETATHCPFPKLANSGRVVVVDSRPVLSTLCANDPASLSHFKASAERKQKGRKLLYGCDKTYAGS
jgi:hypothetical protein